MKSGMSPQMSRRADKLPELESVEVLAASSLFRGALARGLECPETAEKFRLLARHLHRARLEKPLRTVLVTSAVPWEGKSMVAANLAAALAAGSARTLLIDADLRVAGAQKSIVPDAPYGLGAALAGGLAPEHVLRRVDPPGFYFLPSGEPAGNPVPLLESFGFGDMLEWSRRTFDWVVIDSTPLNPLADAHCIAPLADAILLVVRWGFTPRKELDHALESLRGLPLLGMVVNQFDDRQDSHYHSYYRQTGAQFPD